MTSYLVRSQVNHDYTAAAPAPCYTTNEGCLKYYTWLDYHLHGTKKFLKPYSVTPSLENAPFHQMAAATLLELSTTYTAVNNYIIQQLKCIAAFIYLENVTPYFVFQSSCYVYASVSRLYNKLVSGISFIHKFHMHWTLSLLISLLQEK